MMLYEMGKFDQREALPPTEVVEVMRAFHGAQMQLCARLEALADGLPINFDTNEALIVARQIMPLISDAHRFEESAVFALVEDVSEAQSLERLKFEHWEDEASGEDLTDALLTYARMPDAAKSDRLAYMLRGFFDNLRRHVAFEAEHILPIIAGKA